MAARSTSPTKKAAAKAKAAPRQRAGTGAQKPVKASKAPAKRKAPARKPNARTGKSGASTERPSKRTGGNRRRPTVAILREMHEEGIDVSDKRAFMRLGRANTQILVGTEDLSLWDDEELQRGQRKGPRGRFEGAPPKIVPKAIHDELVKRTLAKASETMRSNLVAATEALTAIATDLEADPAARLRAIQMIQDRVMGKAPDKVDVSVDMPWLDAITDGIVATDNDMEAGLGQIIDTTAEEA